MTTAATDTSPPGQLRVLDVTDAPYANVTVDIFVNPPVGPGQQTYQSTRLGSGTKTYEPWVSFAIARSDSKGVTAKYTRRQSQAKTIASSLGVGLRENGNITVSGRQTHQSSWSTGFEAVENNARQYETKWLYGTWQKKVCLRGGAYYYKYITQPIENQKTTREVAPSPYTAPHCIGTIRGQWLEIANQRNVEWAYGAQLKAQGFEADLSAQTGYSSEDKLRFQWKKDPGRLSGQYARPANDAGTTVGSLMAK